MKLILTRFNAMNSSQERFVFNGKLEQTNAENHSAPVHKPLNLIMLDLSSSNMILENILRDEFEISAIVINLFSSANKISEAMVKAVKDLSTREYEILVDLVHDYKYSEIASKRHIDLETVKSHVSHIYSKLGVQCKAMAKLVYFAHLSATSG